MKTLPEMGKIVANFEEALARIAELEKALDDTISMLVKRDALLESYERRLRQAQMNGLIPPDEAR